MTKDQEDKMYMRIAQIVAEQSYCIKRKVGAIIVKDNTIIGLGFNGTPSGRDNCCEIDVMSSNDRGIGSWTDKVLVTKPEVLHAESNAIAKVACSTLSSVGSTLYVTCSPCIECAKLIIQSKIKEVVYRDLYHETNGLELLRSVGIEVRQFMPE